MIDIAEEEPIGPDVRSLVALHLASMRDGSPPGHSFALDLAALRAPDVTVWSVRREGELAGMGALKVLGDGRGEIKSMRTHPDHLRTGIAAALLDHILAEAQARGLSRLSLETGRGPAFEPALALYRKRGFAAGNAFGDYRPSDFSQFFHLEL